MKVVPLAFCAFQVFIYLRDEVRTEWNDVGRRPQILTHP